MDITTIVTGILSLLGGNLIGVFLERRKRIAEVKVVEADFNAKMQETYARFVDDAKKEYEDLKSRFEELYNQNTELKMQNESLKKQNNAVLRENNKLKKEMKELRNLIQGMHKIKIIK